VKTEGKEQLLELLISYEQKGRKEGVKHLVRNMEKWNGCKGNCAPNGSCGRRRPRLVERRIDVIKGREISLFYCAGRMRKLESDYEIADC